MREFQDETGAVWIASPGERAGDDYKGRYHVLFRPKEGGEGDVVFLEDIRWNAARTAERTLLTMSEVELRKRLRWARGRTPALR